MTNQSKKKTKKMIMDAPVEPVVEEGIREKKKGANGVGVDNEHIRT